MQIGWLGFGKMGSRMVFKLLVDGHQVVVWNRSSKPVEEFKTQNSKLKIITQNVKVANSIEDLMTHLQKPRIIWLMLPAGEASESVLTEVIKLVEPGDIIIDGGNAHFSDTERRSKNLSAKGIKFLGIGVSGGVHALENGYPLMAGGDVSAYRYITTILDSLAKPNGGHAYFGTGGAGHFVKMVHNGIEYGMMQALGEGFGVFDKSPYNLDLLEIAKLYQKGTIISGFLMDQAKNALGKDSILSSIEGKIDASGEGEWTVAEAKKEGVPIENIEQSLDFRRRSQTDQAVQDSFAAKMVAALRHEFGGHALHRLVRGHGAKKQ